MNVISDVIFVETLEPSCYLCAWICTSLDNSFCIV